ncbi:conserved hypothetical protein [Rippkaea orientalis PCC 8801]|uniref:Uncharacterized protein n=1 Tax=Rippkaea orientalis (strain PCC 8801 / RF-1) TaxID=41431 RepID=B7JZB4_RIPO1|nr:hypothetical protein [Rippkaea orientalis]ACK67325.1 conserved hypothetical protein [Rippkaea orientalis PCC 8801]
MIIRKYIEFFKSLRKKFFNPLLEQFLLILNKLEAIQESLGRIEFRQTRDDNSLGLLSHEFRVFSQWGEDGIIQYLVNTVEINHKTFVEFGVEDYTECNTKFLLINNNWTGLVIDSDSDCIERIKKNKIYWSYNLKAIEAFVTQDNINSILQTNGFKGDIGLLSIDIDGNDYWIWKAITVINPIIVIIEYNYRFDSSIAVTIPYHENFDRQKAHHSMIYFGASLKALCLLGKEKGYDFIGCCSSGVNAFFIRQDKRPNYLKILTPEEGYVMGKFCEFRDEQGSLKKMTPHQEKEFLQNLDLPLIQVN